MSAFSGIVTFFKVGGFFLYPILLVWIIGLAIGVERFLHLRGVGLNNNRLWSALKPLFEKSQFEQAKKIVYSAKGCMADVLKYGLSRIETAKDRDDIEKAMEESLIEVIPDLERRTHYINSLANIVMLMGLFGTVLGLIHAFEAVAQANAAEKAALLSASISEAMHNTALGLIAAISLLLVHMYIQTKTTDLVDSLEVATVKFLNSVKEFGASTTSR